MFPSIYHLSNIQFSKLINDSGDGAMRSVDESCSMCLAEFRDEDVVSQLNRCRHVFHAGCIEGWLDRDQFTCPLCRSTLLCKPSKEVELSQNSNAEFIPWQWFSLLAVVYGICGFSCWLYWPAFERGCVSDSLPFATSGFLDSGGGGGKKKKINNNDTLNEVGPVGDTSTVMEGVTPSTIDMTVEKEKLSSLEDTTVLGSFPPLPTHVTTSAGDAPGKSSYANFTGKPSGKKVNVHTLFTPGGNGIDVVVPVDSIRTINAMLENGPWFIRNNPHILKKWHPDVSIVSVWVKLHGVLVTTFSEDGLSVIATKLGASEKKTVKKPSKTSRGVPVGPKIGFKPQKEYRPVIKKPNASSSSNNKNGVVPTVEVSNSNPFDALNSVDNDGEFGTNGRTTNLVNNKATSSGSSFMNINNVGEFASNTPIGEKIDKIKRQIGEGKLRLLDNDGNPLVPTGIVQSDSEVDVVFDETANLRILTSGKDGSDKGYGTNSLLEQ
nr:RING-H2 finger protein ATL18 [Tanacetum cinerariifolium]